MKWFYFFPRFLFTVCSGKAQIHPEESKWMTLREPSLCIRKAASENGSSSVLISREQVG